MEPVAGTPVPEFVLDRLPSWLRALVAQAAAWAIVVLVGKGLWIVTGTGFGVLALCAAQALLAAGIGRVLRLAPWWTVIQLGFAPTVMLVSAAHLPPGLFLIAFLVLSSLYWSTYRTQVPLYPSSRAVWEAVARLLPHDRALRIVDVGSGMGGLVLHLAKSRADCTVLGVELAPVPWLASALRAAWARSTARFLRIDYQRLDLGQHDVVFAFLSPAAMPSLWQKAQQEMVPGSLFLSLAFPVPGAHPDMSIAVPGLRGGTLCGWRIRPRGEGC